jgi:predicted ATPase
MLNSIRLQSFKGHRDTTVRLGRLTILVGPNGAGKTSVLQALLALTQLVDTQPQEVLFGSQSPADLLDRGSPGPIVLDLEGNDAEVPWSISAEIPVSTKRGADNRPTLAWTYGDASGQRPQSDLPFRNCWGTLPLGELLGPAVLYRFDAEVIAAASLNDEISPAVAPDGKDTAAVLAALKLENEDAFGRIQAELRRVVPQVERVRVRRVPVRKSVGHQIFLDLRGAPDIPAHAASEGTLVTLALLTVLLSPLHPRLVLLDDLDHALHPEAQTELVRQLKRLLDEMPDLQIVASTHSPYILDELDPADVQVFALRGDGSAATKRLSEHPQAAQSAGALTAGQLWSLDPERRWVAEEG